MTPASAMRVEVDVYKGPLSKSVDIQCSELQAITEQADLVARRYDSFLLKSNINTSRQIGQYDWMQLETLKQQSNQILIELTALKKRQSCNSDSLNGYLKKGAATAITLKAISVNITASFLPYITNNDELRVAQVLLAQLASEYGNQIGSRVNALQIQVDCKEPIDRRKLPLSVYLSDSQTTDINNLFVWLKAKAPSEVEAWTSGVFGPMDSVSRVRMFERLYGDNYWSRINTVYASGMGKTTIALIRDGVGNWDLKSFDNEPADLVTAYNKVGTSVLGAAASLAAQAATMGASDVATSKRLLDVALDSTNKAFQKRISPAGDNQVNEWRGKFIQELELAKSDLKNNPLCGTPTDPKCDPCCKDPTSDGCIKAANDKIKPILERYRNGLEVFELSSVSQ
ncbi:MAG: hypothetical protein HQL95_10895 [Magnetococcales bacterium]|nr:hypothetical protein [Magnetococcales bacterium]